MLETLVAACELLVAACRSSPLTRTKPSPPALGAQSSTDPIGSPQQWHLVSEQCHWAGTLWAVM